MNIELIYNYDKESWIVYLLLLKIKLYCHLLFKGKTECPLNDLACSKQTGDAKKDKEDACQIPFRGKNMKKCRTEDCKKCENQVLPYYSVFFKQLFSRSFYTLLLDGCWVFEIDISWKSANCWTVMEYRFLLAILKLKMIAILCCTLAQI